MQNGLPKLQKGDALFSLQIPSLLHFTWIFRKGYVPVCYSLEKITVPSIGNRDSEECRIRLSYSFPLNKQFLNPCSFITARIASSFLLLK